MSKPTNTIQGETEKQKVINLGTYFQRKGRLINNSNKMKKTQSSGKECKNCQQLLPGGYIRVDDVKNPHCSDCGKEIVSQPVPTKDKAVLDRFDEEFLRNEYCGDRECMYEGEDRCFHGSETETKAFLLKELHNAYEEGFKDGFKDCQGMVQRGEHANCCLKSKYQESEG